MEDYVQIKWQYASECQLLVVCVCGGGNGRVVCPFLLVGIQLFE